MCGSTVWSNSLGISIDGSEVKPIDALSGSEIFPSSSSL